MNVFTENDLQEILKLSEKQVKALMRTDGFPSCKIGGKYRVTETALQKWMESTKSIKLNYQKI